MLEIGQNRHAYGVQAGCAVVSERVQRRVRAQTAVRCVRVRHAKDRSACRIGGRCGNRLLEIGRCNPAIAGLASGAVRELRERIRKRSKRAGAFGDASSYLTSSRSARSGPSASAVASSRKPMPIQ